MRTRRVAGLAAGLVVGVALGASLTLAIQGWAALPDPTVGTPSQEAPVTEPEPPEAFLIWTSGGMPDGFRRDVRHLEGIRRSVVVASDNTWLDRSWSAQGEVIDDPRPGFAIPLEVAAVEPRGLRSISDENAFLRTKELAKVEPIEFRSADGTMIEGLLVKPVDYVPGRRYPTVLRLHGGPVWQFSHEFMSDWQVFAARGYAVVAPNPRGSSGRGFEFAKAIYADWGVKDTADVLAAVDYAVKQGLADPERLGLGGHSYGGILTNQVIARDARFKAAVSSAGVANIFGSWGVDMYIREYELELGLPWRDREAFERVSFPFFNADRIRTATLFICHELDENVPCIGSMQMYQALRALGVPTRLVIYPGEYHGLTVPSYIKDKMQRILNWYGLYLGVLPPRP